jgi:predicted alpha/beta-hydrolase family hydrolase
VQLAPFEGGSSVGDVLLVHDVSMTDAIVSGYSFQGPRRGADRAVLLAHGAGSDRDGAALRAVSDALAAAGVPSLRFDYPYRSAGRRAPDRPPVLDAATREAAAELARRTALAPERLVLGGRSMGGRVCSLVAAVRPDNPAPVPALGLALLGYPLHPAGKPEQRRDTHFRYLTMPVLFASGTRDSLAPRPELTRSARKVKGPVTMFWIDTADHGYRPLKSSGRTAAAVLADVAAEVVAWVLGLPA